VAAACLADGETFLAGRCPAARRNKARLRRRRQLAAVSNI
jgi:hypothetical protein